MTPAPMDSVVQTVAWFCVAICAVAVASRSVNKARIIRHVGADDVFIWAGFVCFVGQCVSVQIEAQYGVGTDVTQVSSEMRDEQMKGEYANYLLYMPVIAFAKLSVVSVLRKCALNQKDRLLLYIFEWFLTAWAITSELVRLFPCAFPAPWDYVHMSCIDRQAWVVYFELVNILTEVALITIPTLIISHMPTSWERKLVAISYFSARIFIVPASIARIVYWLRASTSSNVTYDLYPFTVATVLVAALEILAACVLYMRSLFEILETGFSMVLINSPTSPKQRGEPKFGPYSKGTWPYTRMSTLEDHLTGRNTSYEAKVQATVYDEKHSPARSDDHIHVSKQVDIQTAYPYMVHCDRMTRMQHSPRSNFSLPRCPSTWHNRELPELPLPERAMV